MWKLHPGYYGALAGRNKSFGVPCPSRRLCSRLGLMGDNSVLGLQGKFVLFLGATAWDWERLE